MLIDELGPMKCDAEENVLRALIVNEYIMDCITFPHYPLRQG